MILMAQPEPAATGSLPDRARQFQALMSDCGVFPAATKLVSLAGRDRVRWLNGMLSNNIRDLSTGRGVYAFVLNPQAHIQGDLYVFHQGERLVAEIENGQLERLLAIFRRYIIMDKVEIEQDERTSVFGLLGPRCGALLAELGLDDQIEPLASVEESWQGVPVHLVRLDHPVLPYYQLWLPAERAETLGGACARAGATAIDADTLEIFRIVSGIPKLGQDIRERDLPQETGQERALHFSKGCYIGQEIVERIRSRGAVHRRFTGFDFEQGRASAGTKIQSQAKDVGEITSVAEVPVEAQPTIGLGYVRKEAASEHEELRAGEARLKLASLPFRKFFGGS
jgi:aminomethyltransferase